MPTEWRRAIVVLSSTITTVVVVMGLYWARSIFIPIALAVLLSFVLSPIVVRLQHRGLGRSWAVLATLTLAALLIAGVGSLVAHQVSQLADTLPGRREAIKEKVAIAKASLVGDGQNRFGQLIDDITEVLAPEPPANAVVLVRPASPSIAAQVEKYLGPAAEILGQFAFTFILIIFMLLRREDLRNRAIRLLGNGRIMATTRAVDDASNRISRYLLSQLALNSSFGVLIAIGLFVIGVKYSLLWGFFSAMMRYVPYIGTWIGLIPPFILSLTTSPEWAGPWGQPLAVLALYVCLEAFCINLIEPRLYGKSMGLSEVAQLVSAAAWAFLWGPIGLILAGPLTVCLLVLGRHVDRFHFLVVILGDEPPLKPRVAFYQRLVAHDQDEAAEMALELARRTGPDEAFDEVLVPALSSARRDAALGDLDAADLTFIVDAVHEISEELDVLREPTRESAADMARILICPARDKLDFVAGQLLALSLEANRWEVKFASAETLASELVELVREFQPAVVVIGTIPPGGRSHARYLVARVRRQFPDQRIVIGRWGPDDEERGGPNDAIKESDGTDRSLADTRKRLSALHAPLAESSSAASPVENKTASPRG
jgi:predicted PurR-regulated permease PerM